MGPANPIVGRAVIIHAKSDDGSQPVGNAGVRVGQGVIGIAKAK
jgi:Cu-Zn family superoxide dismutase